MGCSSRESETDSTGPRRQLDHRQPPHGQERLWQPEPGLSFPDDLGGASRVGVESLAYLGDLGLVGVAADQARVPGGDQARCFGSSGSVVGCRVAPLGDRGVGQCAVDPEHRGDSRHRGDDRDRDHEDAERDQPPLGVMAKQRLDSWHEGKEAQHQSRRERHGQPPQTSHDLAVEETGSEESGGIPVAPLDPLEQRAGLLTGRELGEDLPHDVVAQRRVDGGSRILERVVLIELVAVHHPDQLAVVPGHHGQVAREAHVRHAEAFGEHCGRVPVPGELAVVISGDQHDAMILILSEALDRVGELGMGVQDPGDVRSRGEHLEPVTGDHENPGLVKAVQQLRQLVGGTRGDLRRGRPEVQVAHHDHPAAPPHLEPDEIRNEEGGGGPVCVRRSGGFVWRGRAPAAPGLATHLS